VPQTSLNIDDKIIRRANENGEGFSRPDRAHDRCDARGRSAR